MTERLQDQSRWERVKTIAQQVVRGTGLFTLSPTVAPPPFSPLRAAASNVDERLPRITELLRLDADIDRRVADYPDLPNDNETRTEE